jgi:hypothetical protein
MPLLEREVAPGFERGRVRAGALSIRGHAGTFKTEMDDKPPDTRTRSSCRGSGSAFVQANSDPVLIYPKLVLASSRRLAENSSK